MGSNNTIRTIPMVVALVLILLSSGTADSSDDASPPAMAPRRAGPVPPPAMAPRRAGPVPPPPKSSIAPVPDQDCPLFLVPELIDSCRRLPGPRACTAQCVVRHYRGGFCDMLPHGRPGDCFCINCLSDQLGRDA